MAERKIFVIDIGSSKVNAALAIVGKNNRIYDIASESIRRNICANNDIQYTSDLSDIINSIKQALEKKASVKLQQVFVNVGEQFVTGQFSRAAFALVERSTRRVSFFDVKRVESHARALGLKIDEELLHEFPVRFILDSTVSTTNPIGKLARTLEVELLLITSKTAGLDAISKIVNRAGLRLRRAFFSGLASTVALLKDNMKRKAAVIDIGAANTKIVIINDGVLRQIKVIPFAGNNITDCLASTFKLNPNLAEDLKKTYGSIAAEQLESGEDIMVKMANSYRPIKRSAICKAMLPRVNKLIASIKDNLDFSSHPVDYIFVCGGTAMLDGFLEALEIRLTRPVILGSAYIEHLPTHKRNSFFKNPAQASLLGLLILALERSIFLPYSATAGNGKFLSRLVQKTREIYSDYF
jgi:cell division protein FtsA